jgi:CBS domain containing-hemolysin-like protein
MFHLETILFFILTLILMGFFAGIEMAFYSANRMTIEIKKKQGYNTQQILARFIDSPAIFLGMTLICFTIFLVFFAMQVSNVMSPLWQYLGISSPWIRLISEIILGTLVVLIFGEFIPRAVFRAKSNNILTLFAHIIDFFYQLFQPLATGLISLSEWMLKYMFNVKIDKNKEPLNRSDLRHLFHHTEMDDRQERNSQLMENAQELPRVKIRQCLVPRKEIIGVESHASIPEIKKKFAETKLSKLVIYENNIDHIIGYVHQLDMFKKPASVGDILLPIIAVPESMSATDMVWRYCGYHHHGRCA